MRRREVYGYEILSVGIRQRYRYGEFGCNKAISVDGNVLCVVNEELEGLKGDVDVGWSVLV